MKHKALFVATILVFVGVLLQAATGIETGIKAGLNISQHYGTKDDSMDFEVDTGLRAGAVAGVYLDLVALPNLRLGYELLYSMKGSSQQITIKRMELDGVMEDLAKPAVMNVKYHMDYIEVPVLLKLRVLDRPTWSMQAITGTAMGLKVRGRHRLDGKVYLPNGSSFDEIEITDSSDLKSVNMFDFSFVYGGSLDIKTRIPLFVEYRFTLGWDYLRLPTYELFDPVELRNQTYSLIFGTRF